MKPILGPTGLPIGAGFGSVQTVVPGLGAGVRLTESIEFEFPGGAKIRMPPGDYVILCRGDIEMPNDLGPTVPVVSA